MCFFSYFSRSTRKQSPTLAQNLRFPCHCIDLRTVGNKKKKKIIITSFPSNVEGFTHTHINATHSHHPSPTHAKNKKESRVRAGYFGIRHDDFFRSVETRRYYFSISVSRRCFGQSWRNLSVFRWNSIHANTLVACFSWFGPSFIWNVQYEKLNMCGTANATVRAQNEWKRERKGKKQKCITWSSNTMRREDINPVLTRHCTMHDTEIGTNSSVGKNEFSPIEGIVGAKEKEQWRECD